MRTTTTIAIVAGVCVLSISQDAQAWGPGIHVNLADNLLGNLGILPATVAAILGQHKLSYIFGNIAADVVFAKRLSKVKQFCHHWSTSFRLLDSARDDRSKAFAYGYLSHLAADTVAHNKYVPRQITVSGLSVNLGHLYWELNADAAAGDHAWILLREALRADHDQHHQLLKKHITGTFLPYGMNRAVFDGMNTLWTGENIRRSVDRWAGHRNDGQDSSLLDRYLAECIERMVSVLSLGENSPVLREDPNGTTALMQLRVQRRGRRYLRWLGLNTDRQLREASRSWEPISLDRNSNNKSSSQIPREQ